MDKLRKKKNREREREREENDKKRMNEIQYNLVYCKSYTTRKR